MLDVIHFIFEDDLASASGEQAESRSRTREIVYRDFYEREYRYKTSSSGSSSRSQNYGETYADGTPVDDFSDLEPFDPLEQAKPTKPYMAPTEFNPDAVLPFGKDLDAPLA